jgi:uncharacterized RDD family membrane protein YckC
MQNFSARETEWLLELDGIELACIKDRALAILIDLAIIYTFFFLFTSTFKIAFYSIHWLFHMPIPPHAIIGTGDGHAPDHVLTGIVIPILYFGLLTWRGKGRSPGKRIMGIRVVSLVHRHLSLWHSIERSLGYGAALLEGGFGFFQYFIHPYRRCVQDRIAETIVVTEQSYRSMQFKADHPLLPDTGHIAALHIADESLIPLSPDT